MMKSLKIGTSARSKHFWIFWQENNFILGLFRIPDAEAKKPDDWDETAPEKIPDESAKKPDDWIEEETEYVPDEKAVKPEDW